VIAAMPVGANTKKFLLISSWMRLIKVVLPVPAFPVMKRQLLVFATRSNAFAVLHSVVRVLKCSFPYRRLLFSDAKLRRCSVVFLHNKNNLGQYDEICHIALNL
jgi:hypothetical protein